MATKRKLSMTADVSVPKKPRPDSLPSLASENQGNITRQVVAHSTDDNRLDASKELEQAVSHIDPTQSIVQEEVKDPPIVDAGSEPSVLTSHDRGFHGFLNKQGWHSVNNPNMDTPDVVNGNDMNIEEGESPFVHIIPESNAAQAKNVEEQGSYSDVESLEDGITDQVDYGDDKDDATPEVRADGMEDNETRNPMQRVQYRIHVPFFTQKHFTELSRKGQKEKTDGYIITGHSHAKRMSTTGNKISAKSKLRKRHKVQDNGKVQNQGVKPKQKSTADQLPLHKPNTKENEADQESNDSTGRHWELVDGNASTPKLGVPSPELLKVHVIHKVSKETRVYEFKKIKEDEIDWTNKEHIQAIGTWRRQVIRRSGGELMRVGVGYEPDEEAFLLLLHRKIKAVVGGDVVIKIPNSTAIQEAFNTFFVGKTILNKQGQLIGPRAPRDGKSLKAKYNRKSTELYKLREEIKTALENKTGGEAYVPAITDAELKEYQESGTVVVDDLTVPKITKVVAKGKSGKPGIVTIEK